MVDWNGVIYTYAHNYQGDIIAILDSTGAAVVKYYYDAWGRQYKVEGDQKDTLGKLNPFRYRGYVYDEETGLYYLRSRYYNPEWGRFISSDSVLGKVGAVGSHNLFAYCGNNPVRNIDPDGHSFNPFPYQSTPFDYRSWIFDDGVKYERWYNAYGWPQAERHWTDHNRPWAHSNPHDHYWNSSDPSQKPSHTDRETVNDPSLRWPGQDEWEKEKEKQDSEKEDNSNSAKYVLEGVGVVALGYLLYQGVKGLIALGAAVPTGGMSLGLLAVP